MSITGGLDWEAQGLVRPITVLACTILYPILWSKPTRRGHTWQKMPWTYRLCFVPRFWSPRFTESKVVPQVWFVTIELTKDTRHQDLGSYCHDMTSEMIWVDVFLRIRWFVYFSSEWIPFWGRIYVIIYLFLKILFDGLDAVGYSYSFSLLSFLQSSSRSGTCATPVGCLQIGGGLSHLARRLPWDELLLM